MEEIARSESKDLELGWGMYSVNQKLFWVGKIWLNWNIRDGLLKEWYLCHKWDSTATLHHSATLTYAKLLPHGMGRGVK